MPALQAMSTGYISDQAELKSSLFVCVCEPLLSQDVADAEVSHDFPGYTIHRAARVGGGVGEWPSI